MSPRCKAGKEDIVHRLHQVGSRFLQVRTVRHQLAHRLVREAARAGDSRTVMRDILTDLYNQFVECSCVFVYPIIPRCRRPKMFHYVYLCALCAHKSFGLTVINFPVTCKAWLFCIRLRVPHFVIAGVMFFECKNDRYYI